MSTPQAFQNMPTLQQIENLDNLPKLLSCPSCYKILENATTLSCGHSLCSNCCPLDSAQIVCAVEDCKKTHSYPFIKTDVIIGGIVDIFKNYIQSLSSGPQIIQPNSCASNSGDKYLMLEQDIYNQLECNVCYSILHDPVTTSCGHTFCRHCIIRSLDYKDQCPFCRTQLFNFHSAFSCPPNHLINSLTTIIFPEATKARSIQLKNEKQLQIDETPIFIFSLAFPTSTYHLHFFEPRYRLMIRRCLESGKPRFGMVLNDENGTGYKDYGTMLEIKQWECLPDGRFVVVTEGIHRFKILSRSMRDGYHVAKVQKLPEISQQQESLVATPSSDGSESSNTPPSTTPTYEEIKKECISFVQSLKNSNIPWLMDRLAFSAPTIPEDPSDFSFWAISVMPMNDHEKYPILHLDNYMDRLLLVNAWIHQIKSQWWYKKLC
ncbi:hypothetical protein CONCODRAFT_79773 [Conidiobolus coronatus NRRL 28638]|uniref:LON-domain-containing protein n=1 Tax=Conidiobolus coronatus (strain ATCC 28846 / CBS 209.66 / NRRL 28638) TaxID=796925 RepID=A0A137P0A7_CONC2|nr:hypothetical protein CONCODRAFT_79773 [Conidiobolus coronatus NRRL 28638]|eukprot:KXN68341.1 hypothetical protein CONCODRAFT_79773 [Conidiobolus coronatus NRRL 28638]